VARLEREVAGLAGQPFPVERRSGVVAEEFFERYYAGHSPVVIADALKAWPRLASWSPSYFKEHFGDVEVEVMTRRDSARTPGDETEGRRTLVPFGAFCERVTASTSTNDFYLVANNRVTNRPALSGLLDDVRGPHEYLHADRDARWTSMWFGPPGTLTPLHHDTSSVLFCQVFGKKRFLLFPAFELFLTHAMHDGVYSAIDPENPDAETFPELAEVRPLEVVLSPGEALFLPVGWWHQVRALEVSISLGFTAFRWPNRFDWYYPGKVG
ncbi:MAG: cupin-like domain-containing protein, partial [Polyangiaceae bacterium]